MTHAFFAFVCLLALQACAQTQPLPQYAMDGTYDGDWSAVMVETAAQQDVAHLQFDCAHFGEPFFIRVTGGVASGYLEADENYSFRTYVDQEGSFTATIPTSIRYHYATGKLTPDSNSAKPKIVLILRGTLSEEQQIGQFVIADPALGFDGCSTLVKFVSL